MLKCLLVDDEAPARNRLRRLLEKAGGVEITGEASHGLEALQMIEAKGPEVIFLDIEMPEMDGFDVARSLGPDGPFIVFVTAYNEFALRAFEVSAVDYIVKPVAEERLQATLSRLQNRRPEMTDYKKLFDLLESQKPKRKLAVRCGNKFVAFDPAQVSAVIARDHYAALIMNGKELLADDSLDVLEKKLAANHFLRVHRGALINLEFLKELEREGDRKYTAVLTDPLNTRVQVSRERLNDLKSRLDL